MVGSATRISPLNFPMFFEMRYDGKDHWPYCTACSCYNDSAHEIGKKHKSRCYWLVENNAIAQALQGGAGTPSSGSSSQRVTQVVGAMFANGMASDPAAPPPPPLGPSPAARGQVLPPGPPGLSSIPPGQVPVKAMPARRPSTSSVASQQSASSQPSQPSEPSHLSPPHVDAMPPVKAAPPGLVPPRMAAPRPPAMDPQQRVQELEAQAAALRANLRALELERDSLRAMIEQMNGV